MRVGLIGYTSGLVTVYHSWSLNQALHAIQYMRRPNYLSIHGSTVKKRKLFVIQLCVMKNPTLIPYAYDFIPDFMYVEISS